jgi:protein involved in polysaccharide export with SLBB domain
LLDLVAKAGGLTPQADGSQVGITRSGDPTKAIQHVDVTGILNGTAKQKADDPLLLLHAGDLVFVPDRQP